MTKSKTVVVVRYQNLDGYHLFTSKDVKGLTVGSSDCRKAFEDVANAIQVLMQANHNIKCTAEPVMSFAEFLHATEANPGETRPFELQMAA